MPVLLRVYAPMSRPKPTPKPLTSDTQVLPEKKTKPARHHFQYPTVPNLNPSKPKATDPKPKPKLPFTEQLKFFGAFSWKSFIWLTTTSMQELWGGMGRAPCSFTVGYEAVEGSCRGHGGSLGTEFRAVGACGFLGPRTSTTAQFDTSRLQVLSNCLENLL